MSLFVIIYWLIDWLTDRATDCLTDWLTDWLTVWLTDCSTGLLKRDLLINLPLGIHSKEDNSGKISLSQCSLIDYNCHCNNFKDKMHAEKAIFIQKCSDDTLQMLCFLPPGVSFSLLDGRFGFLSIKFADSHLYIWVGKDSVKVKYTTRWSR